jgi:hypothetical protein
MHNRRHEGDRSWEGYQRECGEESEQDRTSSGRKTVEDVGGGVETLRPETRRQRGLNQKSTHDIVRGASHALNHAVLGEVYEQDMRN